jgi:hypothetical protein
MALLLLAVAGEEINWFVEGTSVRFRWMGMCTCKSRQAGEQSEGENLMLNEKKSIDRSPYINHLIFGFKTRNGVCLGESSIGVGFKARFTD